MSSQDAKAALSSKTVTMTEPGTVWSIPALEFARIANDHPEMAWKLTEELAVELAAAEAVLQVCACS